MRAHTDTTARRKAARLDLRVVKLRSSHRDYWQYGPYLLSDLGNRLVASGMSLEELHEHLDRYPPQ